ncbi:Rieske 2Fe-2S domain-containing protein [Cyanobium sp. FGCU-6]|nr:Rieske 2Fe-2S domain-containing protein [Cyanobium sp. FGCU6]
MSASSHESLPRGPLERLALDLVSDVNLPEAGAIVEVTALDGRQVCLARLAGGELTAFEPRCPHRGVPLCHGGLEGEQVICLEHFWRWQVRDGQPLGSGHPPLGTYRVDPQGQRLMLLPV